MKATIKKLLRDNTIVLDPKYPDQKILELWWHVTINLPRTKVLEYRQISIGMGVFQYLIDFLNESIDQFNRISLVIPQKDEIHYSIQHGYKTTWLDCGENINKIELSINRFTNIYEGDYVEINGDSAVNIGAYLHVINHSVKGVYDPFLNQTGYNQRLDPTSPDYLHKFFNLYRYIFDTLIFEIEGNMRFKHINDHEAKVVLINPSSLKRIFRGEITKEDLNNKMNDPFINKL